MSKRIFIIRHAKSDWGKPLAQDHDRPLNKRGNKDASEMGKRLKAFGAAPNKIFSSTAKRAAMTATLIAEQIGVDLGDVIFDKAIYIGDSHDYISYIEGVSDEYDDIFLVGHNPVITDTVNNLANAGIDNIVTCGIACIDFDVESWVDISPTTSNLVFYDFPKNK